MTNGRRSGAGVALALSIMGFIFFLFIFWPIAFAILFVGLAIYCALQSAQRTEPPRAPQERSPRRYQIPPTPPQIPEWPPRRPLYRPLPGREPSQQSGVRVPIEESEPEPETERIFRMPKEEEEPEVSISIPERISREEPRVSAAEESAASGDLEEELEATRSKIKQMSTEVETTKETETPPEKQITIPDEKAERIKDLESEEEATQILMEELNGRWMSGKIDIDMYERLKEKYDMKIKDIEKQKKRALK
jgi:hypothetical protein